MCGLKGPTMGSQESPGVIQDIVAFARRFFATSLFAVLFFARHSVCGSRQPKYEAAGIPRFEILVYPTSPLGDRWFRGSYW